MQLPLVVLKMVGSFMSRSKWVSPTERRSCSESVAHAGTAGLAQQLLAVDQEADTIAAALAAAQQQEHQFDEYNGVSCCCKN
jgi:hypothetical protein